jgi:TonB family protein
VISLGLEEPREREPERSGSQMSLFQPQDGEGLLPDQDASEAVPQFLLDSDGERRATLVRRTFFVSLVLHAAAIAFLLMNPDLIHLGSPEIVMLTPEEKEVTMLYAPPLPRPEPQLQAPPAPPAQPRTLPRSAGSDESELEKLTPGSSPERLVEPPPAPRPQPPEPARESAEQRRQREEQQARAAERQTEDQEDMFGIPRFPEIARTPPRQQPSLETLPRPNDRPREQAQLRLEELAPPSRGTDAMLRDMARQRAEGGGQSSGSITAPYDPSNPNFNLPGPQILSDTMGVDFDPYLLRVYLIVRRNWYSVIPEIARLGRKGRVVLQFQIARNGSVTGLTMMDGSGTESMDAAALSSIRLSNPFPDLPSEYPGGEILLRFGYYYNMQPEYSR